MFHTYTSLIQSTLREGSVGLRMNTTFLQLPESLTAGEAITALRGEIATTQDSSYIYLHDGNRKLSGVVSFRELVRAEKNAPLRSVASEVTHSALPEDDDEKCAHLIFDENLRGLPITAGGELVGVLSADEAGSILDNETDEDFQLIAPTRLLKTSLKETGVWALYRSRVLWLVVLVFGNIFSGAGIAYFEDLIAASVALVFFLPLLIDSGGNAGSQSATLMVRALATGQVRPRDWAHLIAREAMISALLGGTMALAVSILGILRGGPDIALAVALSMVVIVMIGSLIGMSLPFILQKIGLDPANASAPLVTSICDGVGVLVYFFIASQIML
ncbi:magnesium transporter [Corynebacterium timonense]|uniref:Magnesium transporter n=1 Tax=Corynebacterium timonense TaxID=441500 RepID=A0A1H1NME0_9CORY|nr:magnesium transporter [Corynebacterium timonense]SDS00020.1 magnesium transporter [Corynebacterium timonense]